MSDSTDAKTLVLGASNAPRTVQVALSGIAAACFVAVAVTTNTLGSEVLFGALALLFGWGTWQFFTMGRCRHEMTTETLKIRSPGVSRDLPLQSIAGVGLIQTELRSVVASYRAWQPFVWTSDRAGVRLRGITVLERRRSDQALMQTRPGRVALEIFQYVADRQGPTGPLNRHQVQPMATSPPSLIELLPGTSTEEPIFQRWNPGTHWQPENT